MRSAVFFSILTIMVWNSAHVANVRNIEKKKKRSSSHELVRVEEEKWGYTYFFFVHKNGDLACGMCDFSSFFFFSKAQTGQEEQIKLYWRDSRDGQLSLERRSNSGTERSVDAGRKKGAVALHSLWELALLSTRKCMRAWMATGGRSLKFSILFIYLFISVYQRAL